MTGQRRTIARVLSEAEDHPDVEEVYRRASAQDPRISLSTVYRTVRLFENEGILERHEFGDGKRARYEPAGHGHHDHLINVKTGEVIGKVGAYDPFAARPADLKVKHPEIFDARFRCLLHFEMFSGHNLLERLDPDKHVHSFWLIDDTDAKK